MANKQTTAVEWLSGKLVEILGDKCNELNVEQTLKNHYTFKQALQMEREQIETAYILGLIHPLEMEASKQAKKYYTETYGKE